MQIKQRFLPSHHKNLFCLSAYVNGIKLQISCLVAVAAVAVAGNAIPIGPVIEHVVSYTSRFI